MPSLPYAIALTVALLCAVAGGRRAFAAGMAITAGWVLYNAAWWDYSPAALTGLGSVDIWCVTTVVLSTFILTIGWRQWWSYAMWGVFCAQMTLHCAYQFNALDWTPYSKALDALFLALLAVLYAVGGPTIVDRMLDYYHRCRDGFHSAGPTPSKAQAQ